ncbi:FAD:protein FMN transferase [Sphingomonas flavalba]|uniref:FAD:protein FMN transferase n=1 Tax=Sphingomonas flavalba TaxID=2559804 RepID=UPI00109E334B|nr:FAD:protein FMN transferase [Sphingomonas flavalba]
MGTSWSVRAVSPPPGLAAAIQRILDAVVAEMSPWEPGSDISRFNRSPVGAWQALPPAFVTVLRAALDVAALSGGAFDPAIGALVDQWGFGPKPGSGAPPTDVAIAAALAEAGHDAIELDAPCLRARRTRAAELDFSGIAKGYGVDCVAEHLLASGIAHFLVEVGGELRGAGVKPDGQPWWVDLELPPGAGFAPSRVALHGMAVATSGDYRRWFAHGGQRYAHSIDPRTGRPLANGVHSVTVLHPQCMLADAWATALTVLGPEAGLALAEAEGLAALIQSDAGEAMSSGFRAMLE